MTTAAAHHGISSSPTDTAGVIAPPPLIYLGTLGIGLGLDAVIGTGSLPSALTLTVGPASIIAGVGLLGSFRQAFQRARTPIDPYSPTQAVVTDGPYKLTRNPAYLGMAVTYAGIATVANAPCGAPPAAGRDRGHRPRRDRARGALPGAEVRHAIGGLQAPCPAMDLNRHSPHFDRHGR